jgi:hypothetical protein
MYEFVVVLIATTELRASGHTPTSPPLYYDLRVQLSRTNQRARYSEAFDPDEFAPDEQRSTDTSTTMHHVASGGSPPDYYYLAPKLDCV